jgi:hypothetical protein
VSVFPITYNAPDSPIRIRRKGLHDIQQKIRIEPYIVVNERNEISLSGLDSDITLDRSAARVPNVIYRDWIVLLDPFYNIFRFAAAVRETVDDHDLERLK